LEVTYGRIVVLIDVKKERRFCRLLGAPVSSRFTLDRQTFPMFSSTSTVLASERASAIRVPHIDKRNAIWC